jgi:hypothetical protein
MAWWFAFLRRPALRIEVEEVEEGGREEREMGRAASSWGRATDKERETRPAVFVEAGVVVLLVLLLIPATPPPQ